MRQSWTALVVGAAIAIYAVTIADGYGLRVLSIAGCFAIMVMGYQFVFGHLGVLSLAQGAFFGLGAYTTAILGAQHGLPALATIPASIMVPILAAALVAIPVLRLETHYFALATLVLAQAALLAALHWETLTGGANGIPAIPGLRFGAWSLGPGPSMTLIIWLCVALAGAYAWGPARGARALALSCLRDRPMAAAAMGLDGMQARFGAFLASAAFGGLAGALHAHVVGVVSPDGLELPVMIACLSMAVIGGRTRVIGAVLGALLLVHLPEWFREFERLYLILYGGALLSFVIAAPEGLAGLAVRLGGAGKHGDAVRPTSPSTPPEPATPRPGARATLALDHVHKRFGGVVALDDVSLNVRPGVVLALMGPNGSGKSTLLNVATGFVRADGGQVRLNELSIADRPAHAIARLGVARSFQATDLLSDATAEDNVALAVLARAHADTLGSWWPRTAIDMGPARAEARQWLSEWGAEACANGRAGSLPAGARRLVECARAAALRPRVLVLDEPGAGLAPVEKARLSTTLRALAKNGTAILIVDHDTAFLFATADRVACLDRGRLIAEGSPAEIRSHPAVVAAYLGGVS
jgi:branched-chain amino acid transport system permease protein